MNRRSGSWRSGSGVTLHTLDWQPEGETKGVVVIAHGYAEHAGRYGAVAQALTARGLAVHALDYPGHGRSAGRRGEVRSFASLAADLGSFVTALRSESPGQPCGLLGHSFGGAIAVALCTERPQLIDALALSSPYLRHGKTVTPTQARLISFAARFFPRLGVDRIDPEDLSRIPEEVTAYRSDPLVFHRRVPAATVVELFAGFTALQRAQNLDVPLLVVHGNEDRVAHPDASRELVARVRSPDVTIEIVPGGLHELFTDVGRAATVELVSDWLAQRLAAASKSSGDS